MEFSVIPIGYVKKSQSQVTIAIIDEYWDATTHLERFSHAIILWWIDRRDNPSDRKAVLAMPPKKKGNDPTGVFACRSSSRPNPIGHTIVKIDSLDPVNKRIVIDYIDADSDSPVLDIKPYLPSSDRVENAKVATWFRDLQPRYC